MTQRLETIWTLVIYRRWSHEPKTNQNLYVYRSFVLHTCLSKCHDWTERKGVSYLTQRLETIWTLIIYKRWSHESKTNQNLFVYRSFVLHTCLSKCYYDWTERKGVSCLTQGLEIIWTILFLGLQKRLQWIQRKEHIMSMRV